MNCCGEVRRRAATPSRQAPARRVDSVTPPAVPQTGGTVALRYLGETPITLRGPHSGRSYHIRTGERQIAADEQDVRALLGTGRFKRVHG